MHTKHTFACVRTFHQAFFIRAAPKIGGKLLVGLLTNVSRRFQNRHRISVAFPAKPLRPPVTCFRRKRIHSTNTAIELHVCRNFRLSCCCKTCSGLSPDSLVQPNKDACPFHNVERVAHLPQKPDVIFSFQFMHSLRRFSIRKMLNSASFSQSLPLCERIFACYSSSSIAQAKKMSIIHSIFCFKKGWHKTHLFQCVQMQVFHWDGIKESSRARL